MIALHEAIVEARVCDIVDVGLHVDPSAQRPEKEGPFYSLDERRIILSGLKHVGQVYEYHTEADLVELLKWLEPNVRLLGEDYQGQPFTGQELHIPIYYTRRHTGWSASAIRQRIKEGRHWKGNIAGESVASGG